MPCHIDLFYNPAFSLNGILVVNTSGRIVDWNKRFLELWHIPDDLLSSRIDDQALTYGLEQMANPDEFMEKARELYSQPEEESIDMDSAEFVLRGSNVRCAFNLPDDLWVFLNIEGKIPIEFYRPLQTLYFR
jgi:PAS domain-containing protein